eukprot:COSAG02_NODE_5536_length_4247_cov_1.589923_5_plen_76_part_00
MSVSQFEVQQLTWGDVAKALLACGVPYLQLDLLAANHNAFDFVVDAACTQRHADSHVAISIHNVRDAQDCLRWIG